MSATDEQPGAIAIERVEGEPPAPARSRFAAVREALEGLCDEAIKAKGFESEWMKLTAEWTGDVKKIVLQITAVNWRHTGGVVRLERRVAGNVVYVRAVRRTNRTSASVDHH